MIKNVANFVKSACAGIVTPGFTLAALFAVTVGGLTALIVGVAIILLEAYADE